MLLYLESARNRFSLVLFFDPFRYMQLTYNTMRFDVKGKIKKWNIARFE